jgi:uncharacterized membrane protein HdeD (DUF308 family)
MVVGILMIIGGLFALYASALTSMVTVLYLGVMLALVGILEIASAIRMRHHQPFLVYLLAGVFALVVGVLFIARPVTGLLSVSFLIAGYLFASGLFHGVVAVADRYPRWGWDVAYSIITIGLGMYLLSSWPVSSMFVLGAIVGLEIIARGVALVAAAWVVRDIQHSGRMGLGAA